MGIRETIKAIENAWLTISEDGFPLYRLNEDGSPITPVQLEEYTMVTSKNYGLPVNTADYLPKPQATVAYA